MDRFSFTLPALLKIIGEDVEQKALELSTRNMSAGGAFLFTHSPLPLGSRVDMEIDLPVELIKHEGGQKPRIHVKGEVVRTEPTGMAVSFYEKYRITRLSVPTS